VVASLEAENRRRHQEPRESTLDHFVWRVNSFQAREVVLEFVNRGVTIDLFEVVSEPPLQCERPSPCTLKRAAEGRVRVFSSEPLPEEIVVRCRYTLYPQEAAFRIRPSGPVKLQRL
jgi:hypothetical protein